MNKEFFWNIVFLVVVNLLIKPLFIFGIDRNVQNLVGESAYGLYFSLYSFTLLFQIINDFGIQNFTMRVVSQNRHLSGKYLSHTLGLKIVLALVYLVFVGLFTVVLGYDSSYYTLLLFIAINQILTSFMQYLRSNAANLGHYRLNSLLTVADRFLMIVFCGLALFLPYFQPYFDIPTFVHLQNFTLFLTLILIIGALYGKGLRLRVRFNRAYFSHLLRGAAPYALMVFLMTLYTRTDVVMLERLLPHPIGARQAGIYASAYRLLDAVNVLGYLFAGLLLPMFARQIKEKEPVTPLLRFSFQLIFIASVAIAALVWPHKTALMQWLYHEATPFSGQVLGILMFSFVAVSGIYVYSTLLGAYSVTRAMNYTFVAALVVNIGLNILLIPRYYALGAAFSTLATQFFVLSVLLWLTRYRIGLPTDGIWWLKLGVFAAMSLFLAYFWTYFWAEKWLLQMGVAGLSIGLLAFIMGLIHPKMTRLWLKKQAD